jgi:hypothetical protein
MEAEPKDEDRRMNLPRVLLKESPRELFKSGFEHRLTQSFKTRDPGLEGWRSTVTTNQKKAPPHRPQKEGTEPNDSAEGPGITRWETPCRTRKAAGAVSHQV